MRRALTLLAIAVGIGLIIEPLALKLFPRAAAGQRVTDRFRSTMSLTGLAALQANFNTMGAFTNQLIGSAPRLTRQLGMTGDEFDAYIQSNFPAVATGIREIPPAAAFVGPVIPKLVGARGEFASVDSLPGLGLPITAIPWLLIGLGIALVASGAMLWVRPGAAPVAVVLALGVGMIAVPFALSLPSKADDARRIAALGKIALSRQAADKALAATKVIDATVTETDSRLLPAIGHRLGLTRGGLDVIVARNFPVIAAGLRSWPSIRPGAFQLATIQGRSVADSREMNGTPFGALAWLIIAPGAALGLLAALALRQTGVRAYKSSRQPVAG
jgi:hypothetical protein